MICPDCKTKYYSKTHCPNCGLGAFSLSKGRRTPTKANYRSLYIITVAFFLTAVFISMFFLKYAKKDENKGNVKEEYPKLSMIKITDGQEKGKTGQNIPRQIISNLNDKLKNVTNDIIELNKSGVKAYGEADYDRAYIYFLQVYALNSTNGTINRNLYNTLVSKGSVLLEAGQYDDAMTSFKKALKYIDDNPAAYKGMGIAYTEAGDFERALGELLTAYKLSEAINNSSDELKLTIAKLYFKNEDYENSKKYISLIEDKEKFSEDIDAYSKISQKNIDDTKGKSKTKTSHFKVYYDGYEDEVTGNLVSMILEEAYFNVGRALGYYPTEKVTVILYTEKQFKEDIDMPKWVGAIFDGKIRLPAGGIKDRSDKLKEVIIHEYTHAVIFLKTNNNCPTWLNEGLAQILSGAKKPEKRAVTYAVQKRALPDLDTLNGSFLDMADEEAYLSYMISRLFTRYIIDNSGMNPVNSFLVNLSDGANSNSAFKKAFYTGMSDTYDDFINQLKSKYK